MKSKRTYKFVRIDAATHRLLIKLRAASPIRLTIGQTVAKLAAEAKR